MKVKVKVMLDGGRCDFCQVNESKHTINGGLWWICDKCMIQQFGGEEE
jgi:ribosomal protein L37AE/L43A